MLKVVVFFIVLIFPIILHSQAQLSLSIGNRDFNVVDSDIKSDHHGDEFTTGRPTLEFEAYFYKQSKNGWGFFYGTEGHINPAGHYSGNVCFGSFHNVVVLSKLLQPKVQINVAPHEFNVFVGVRGFVFGNFFIEGMYDLYGDDKYPVFGVGYSLPVNY
jgi:hypothetical protein